MVGEEGFHAARFSSRRRARSYARWVRQHGSRAVLRRYHRADLLAARDEVLDAGLDQRVTIAERIWPSTEGKS